ncbi:MAG TPA: hypothetical protein VGW34_03250 [Allosphingosinicella sp.]|nr:hypothetical protein [Allosphingosinicella sp.]
MENNDIDANYRRLLAARCDEHAKPEAKHSESARALFGECAAFIRASGEALDIVSRSGWDRAQVGGKVFASASDFFDYLLATADQRAA